jgi:hypothetical protein
MTVRITTPRATALSASAVKRRLSKSADQQFTGSLLADDGFCEDDDLILPPHRAISGLVTMGRPQ